MDDLNEDALCSILMFLDVVTLSRSQMVCRNWNHLIGTSVLEQKFTNGQQTKRFVTNKQLRTAARKYEMTKLSYTRSTTSRNMDEQERCTDVLEEIACSYGWPIGKWDVSRIVDFSLIFRRGSTFNEDISAWDVSKGITMCSMFHGANSFNRDISMWDVSNVTNMSHMFREATAFNRDLARWDTSSVTDMRFMFQDALHFNQDLSSWDVSKVEHTNGMFMNATAFNRFLSGMQQRHDVLDMFYCDAQLLAKSCSHISKKQPLPAELEVLTPKMVQNKTGEESKEESHFR